MEVPVTQREREITGPDGQRARAVEVSFQSAQEHWNEYLLDDGSVVRLKPVATEVFRLVDRHDAEGNPIYVLKSTNIVVVRAADHLRQRPGSA